MPNVSRSVVRTQDHPGERAGAVYSTCRRHRFALWRIWNAPAEWRYPEPCPAPLLIFVGLNPSTATERVLDPTVTRCHRRAIALGYSGMVMLNLFSLRSTNPAGLWERPPNHRGNDGEMALWLGNPGARAVAAWGAHPLVSDRLREFRLKLAERKLQPPWWCLGVTQNGAPRHPLYVAYTQPLVEYKLAD